MVGGWLVFLNPKGPLPPGPTSSFCLAAFAGDFLRTENLDPPITCVSLAEGLLWDRPVWMTPIPGHEGQWVVLEHRSGKARRLDLADQASPHKSLFGDFSAAVSDGPWEGLMCLAFHPKFSTNRRYFLKHETLRQEQRWTVLREHRASEDGLRDSGQAPRELCAMAQPADNHNGGTLAFGPDGMLYFAMGMGPQEDPEGHSQNLSSWLKMHRLDVDHAEPGWPRDPPTIRMRAVRTHTCAGRSLPQAAGALALFPSIDSRAIAG